MAKSIISVIGGTGLQGGGVVNALLAQGEFKVRVATRNPASDAARALATFRPPRRTIRLPSRAPRVKTWPRR